MIIAASLICNRTCTSSRGLEEEKLDHITQKKIVLQSSMRTRLKNDEKVIFREWIHEEEKLRQS